MILKNFLTQKNNLFVFAFVLFFDTTAETTFVRDNHSCGRHLFPQFRMNSIRVEICTERTKIFMEKNIFRQLTIVDCRTITNANRLTTTMVDATPRCHLVGTTTAGERSRVCLCIHDHRSGKAPERTA